MSTPLDGKAIIKFPLNTVLKVDGKVKEKINVNVVITKERKK